MEVTGTNAREQNQRQSVANQESTISKSDSVSISNFPQNATLLSDEEAETVLQETVDNIKSDSYSAMFVHSGLDASRVAALLA